MNQRRLDLICLMMANKEAIDKSAATAAAIIPSTGDQELDRTINEAMQAGFRSGVFFTFDLVLDKLPEIPEVDGK